MKPDCDLCVRVQSAVACRIYGSLPCAQGLSSIKWKVLSPLSLEGLQKLHESTKKTKTKQHYGFVNKRDFRLFFFF